MPASRYAVDRLSALGTSSRKVLTIQEAVKKHKNVDFSLDAVAQPSNVEGISSRTNLPLFALMANDPTAAYRVSLATKATKIKKNSDGSLTCSVNYSGFVDEGDVLLSGATFEVGTDNYDLSGRYKILKVYGKSQILIQMENPSAKYNTALTAYVNDDALGDLYQVPKIVTDSIDNVYITTAAAGRSGNYIQKIKFEDNIFDSAVVGAIKDIVLSITQSDGQQTSVPVPPVATTLSKIAAGSVDGQLKLTVGDVSGFSAGSKVRITTSANTMTGEYGWVPGTVVKGSGTLLTVTATANPATISGVVVNADATFTSLSQAVKGNVDWKDTSYSKAGTQENSWDPNKVLGETLADQYWTAMPYRDINGNTRYDRVFFTINAQPSENDIVYLPQSTTDELCFRVKNVGSAANLLGATVVVDGVTQPVDGALWCAQLCPLNPEAPESETAPVDNVFAVVTNTGAVKRVYEGRPSGNAKTLWIETDFRDHTMTFVPYFTENVPITLQDEVFVTSEGNTSTELSQRVSTTADVFLLDASLGSTFQALGLATTETRVDAEGRTVSGYKLNEAGQDIARLWMSVTYTHAGTSYSFDGTIVPKVAGDVNLYIGNTAKTQEAGWTFVINENDALESTAALKDFDLSGACSDNLDTWNMISAEHDFIAFDEDDPAYLHSAIWTYDPRNNNDTQTLTAAWDLFLDKDAAYADYLLAAGTCINNLTLKNRESINYDVMNRMLSICELRKDMFTIHDGLDLPDIEAALLAMGGIGATDALARWGAIYDGRGLYNDTTYTKLQVPIVKSITIGSIIAGLRLSGAWWIPPAGYVNGRIPTGLESSQKIFRSYNYRGDTTSDISRLFNMNINPVRQTGTDGPIIYGDKTMQKTNSSMNMISAVMLVAGIHKRFGNYLERLIFNFNSKALRRDTQAHFQAKLDAIKNFRNYPGIEYGLCICDDSNNTPEVINANTLIVDLIIQPSKTIRRIILRTTVRRVGDDSALNSVTSTLSVL
jgi:hypothetical protein